MWGHQVLVCRALSESREGLGGRLERREDVTTALGQSRLKGGEELQPLGGAMAQGQLRRLT